MKFAKLVKIINEGLSSPKNKGGARVYAAQQSAGPGAYSSSPVGKTDALEVTKPLERWEFNPSEKGDIGASIGSKYYNTMFTSFGLLANDEDFKKNFNKIATVFGERRRGYNLSKNKVNIDGEIQKQKYDYETKLDNLEFMKAKRSAQITELKDILQVYNKRQNDWNKYKNSPLQKNRLRVMYVGLKATIEEIEKQNKKAKNNKFYEIKQIYKDIKDKQESIDKLNHELLLTKSPDSQKKIQRNIDAITNDIDKLNKSLMSNTYAKELPEFKKYRKYSRKFDNIEDKYINSELDESTINREAKEILSLNEKIKDMEDDYNSKVAELEDIYQFIDQINELNMEADADAQAGFIHLVKTTAQKLLNELGIKNFEDFSNLQALNWGDIPKSNRQKIEMLYTLTLDDPKVNPLIGYLNRFQTAYDNREYDSTKQLNKNTNITSLRDFERLPFSVMMNIYKGVSTKPIQLQAKEYDDTRNNTWETLKEYLNAFKGAKGDELFDTYVAPKLTDPELLEIVPDLTGLKVRDVWVNGKSKDLIKRLIKDSGLPESFKDRHILAVAAHKPMATSKTGYNSFMQLLSSIDADIRSTKVKKESFDKMYARIIKERRFDVDDFKLDVMEVLCSMNKHK